PFHLCRRVHFGGRELMDQYEQPRGILRVWADQTTAPLGARIAQGDVPGNWSKLTALELVLDEHGRPVREELLLPTAARTMERVVTRNYRYDAAGHLVAYEHAIAPEEIARRLQNRGEPDKAWTPARAKGGTARFEWRGRDLPDVAVQPLDPE